MNQMEITVQDAPPPDWDAFVARHPGHTLYHTSSWNQLIQRVFRHSVWYFTAREEGVLRAVLPVTLFHSPLFGRFAVSNPFVNYGGILADGPVDGVAWEKALQEFQNEHRLAFVELRHEEIIPINLIPKQHKVTFLLNLPDREEDLWKAFKAKLRSQIRRPTKENMTATVGGAELVPAFYEVFATNMRDLGTPVYSRRFFQEILQTFPRQSDVVIVWSAEHRPVAAALLLSYNGRMEIPWASSLREYNRFSPNMLLYWEALRQAIRKKMKVFDFGRCSPGTGTYRFKKQWGAEEKPLHWYYLTGNGKELPELNPQNPKYQLAIRLWQKMPVGLTKVLGPPIVRQIP